MKGGELQLSFSCSEGSSKIRWPLLEKHLLHQLLPEACHVGFRERILVQRHATAARQEFQENTRVHATLSTVSLARHGHLLVRIRREGFLSSVHSPPLFEYFDERLKCFVLVVAQAVVRSHLSSVDVNDEHEPVAAILIPRNDQLANAAICRMS